MKNLILVLATTTFLFVAAPLRTISAPKTTEKENKTTAISPEAYAEVDAMIVRLNEIKAMDFSTLNSSERKELRKEVRSIEKELKSFNDQTYVEAHHGGIYMSIGAAVLIALLLIILL
jgi:hypothetical protein